MALNLNITTVGAVLFGDERLVKPGYMLKVKERLLILQLVKSC